MEKTLPRMLREVSLKYPDVPAQYTRTTRDGDFSFETYKQLFDTSQLFAAGLLALGTVREEKIGLISDNRNANSNFFALPIQNMCLYNSTNFSLQTFKSFLFFILYIPSILDSPFSNVVDSIK